MSKDFSDWMTRLSERSRTEIPLSKLAIPGSHNSFTFSLDPKSKVGPDESKWIQRITSCCPCLRSGVCYRWSKCQGSDIRDQLRTGVRYFDFRLVARIFGDLRVIHCLYGESVNCIFSRLKNFVILHPKEVILLDFQHLYTFTVQDHSYLTELIKSSFGRWLCPSSENISLLTLKYMENKDYRIIIFYPKNDNFFPRSSCPNPWPNTTKSARLKSFLEIGLTNRNTELFYVSQGILTPTKHFLFFHLLSSLELTLSKKALKTILYKWLPNTKGKPNIVIIDFINSYPEFVEELLRRNQL